MGNDLLTSHHSRRIDERELAGIPRRKYSRPIEELYDARQPKTVP
jgi:hypothetical protein